MKAMYSAYIHLIFVLILGFNTFVARAFSPTILSGRRPKSAMSAHHPFCDLPGDPSLILTTNIDLGDKKIEIMKGQCGAQRTM
jgi:hypothetical protein